MSIWTQVDCKIISPVPLTKEELISFFGKEFDDGEYPEYNDVTFGRMTKEEYKVKRDEWFRRNQEAWEDYKKHEDQYLPTGSEGSLHYKKSRRTARKTEDGRYVYEICGSLRDWSDEYAVIKWFRDGFLRLIRKYDTNDYDFTYKFYGLVTASMGVGELQWKYGQEKVTGNEDW